ncbi:MAG: hypothetical protein MZV64_04370 [Ignavibacteriales bacterium]|nr:hypothetical protein [Ignavibacteriales bacterium]
MSQSADDYEEIIESATGHMRSIRKVAAGEPNDFFIFSNESMITEINKITDPIKIIASGNFINCTYCSWYWNYEYYACIGY